MNGLKTRTIAMTALFCALILGMQPEANAHELRYRPYVPYTMHGYGIGRPVPRWVHEHRDFYRWYRRNQFRFPRRLSWNRLFELYRHDMRHYRYGRHRHWRRDRHGRRIVINY